MPDLVIEDITTDPDPMVVDQLGTVRVEVKNQGPAEMDANKCWVGLYIDRPAEGDPDEQMFCPPLVDGSAIISYTVTLADEAYHALTAWADWLEEIPEEAEVNNQASASILVVSPSHGCCRQWFRRPCWRSQSPLRRTWTFSRPITC